MMSSGGTFSEVKSHDDIEYNISFPTVGATINEEPEPVVFLLGWVGCTEKILSKYSTIYENAGCITIRYTHPTRGLFLQDPSDSQNLRDAAEKLFGLLDDFDLKTNPILVHCFSNGGYWVYRYLADILYVSDVNMVGLIADSAPGRVTFSGGVKTLLAGGVAPNKLLLIIYFFAYIILSVYFGLRRLFGFCKSPPPYEYMRDSHYHTWYHLFLYSSGDQITPAVDITDMAHSRRQNGSLVVFKHDFCTSKHVSHYQDFPQRYRDKCVNFLYSCIQENSKGLSDDNSCMDS